MRFANIIIESILYFKQLNLAISRTKCQLNRSNLAIGIEVSDRHVNRLLEQMGLSTRQSMQSSSLSSVIKGQMIVIDDLDLELLPSF